MNKLTLTLFLSSLFIFSSCSDDKPAEESTNELPPAVEAKVPSVTPKADIPVVYIEELDQFQEYYKEQHETSFSHVKRKNWTSFTAGKNGILTKVLLFGKPNYTISEHYGSSMSGFVRADNPDSGPKYGEWSISREEIVNQLALQGLTETDRGWITIQMRGEIPQEKGRMYFMVCDQISDKRSWFGAFAFAEGNSYKKGRFWLHPEHDLVFRTYVGMTQDQLSKAQKSTTTRISADASVVQANDLPPAPKSMTGSESNFAPPSPGTVKKEEKPDPTETVDKVKENIQETNPAHVPREKNDLQDVESKSTPDPQSSEEEVDFLLVDEADAQKVDANSSAPKKSLFQRFFNKNKDK